MTTFDRPMPHLALDPDDPAAALKVTAVDLQTGETTTEYVAEGDYLLIVVSPATLATVTPADGGETHHITVNGRIPR